MIRRPAHAARLAVVVLVVVATGVVLAACLRQPGQPRPATATDQASSSPSATTTSVRSLEDLDMCELLRPEDLPVKPGPGGRTDQNVGLDGNQCSSTVQLANVLYLLVAGVSRWPDRFEDFEPPAERPGRFVVIDGRRAWVIPSTADPRQCTAIFGAADGRLQVGVLDATQRGVDPCQTATDLARLVISRTPPPAEP